MKPLLLCALIVALSTSPLSADSFPTPAQGILPRLEIPPRKETDKETARLRAQLAQLQAELAIRQSKSIQLQAQLARRQARQNPEQAKSRKQIESLRRQAQRNLSRLWPQRQATERAKSHN